MQSMNALFVIGAKYVGMYLPRIDNGAVNFFDDRIGLEIFAVFIREMWHTFINPLNDVSYQRHFIDFNMPNFRR